MPNSLQDLLWMQCWTSFTHHSASTQVTFPSSCCFGNQLHMGGTGSSSPAHLFHSFPGLFRCCNVEHLQEPTHLTSRRSRELTYPERPLRVGDESPWMSIPLPLPQQGWSQRPTVGSNSKTPQGVTSLLSSVSSQSLRSLPQITYV